MTASAPLSQLARPKILIVDDLPANLVALRRLLAKVDAEVIAAGSGNEALALTLDHDFALVLLDVQMPDIDGFEVAELLRGEDRTRKVPIIFVTAAFKGDMFRLKGYESGAVDYIEKPINEVALLSKVHVFLDLHNSRTELQHLFGLLQEANRQLSVEIEERRRSEEESQQLAGTVFINSAEGILVSDERNNVIAVNPAFTTITGYEAADIIGKNPRMLSSGMQDKAFYADMWKQLKENGRWQGEIWDRRKSGEIFPEWLSISAIYNPDGSVAKYVAIFADITARKQQEAQIWRQANYDNLTGLPNRALFLDRLNHSIADARREQRRLILMFVDLDRFKLVNDSLGHALGDLLLKEASARLTDCVRANDVVARLGGDEFTVILKGGGEAADAAMVADKIIAALSQPFQLQGHQALIGASIGITLFPDDANNDSALLSNADLAMYRAKESGRNTYSFFTRDMDEAVQKLLTLGNELRDALERDELAVYYQPIVDMQSQAVIGAEALVRWHHPRLGLVLPGAFISLAEETGMIGRLSEWILRTACRDIQSLQHPDRAPLSVAVNLSHQHLNLERFANCTAEALDESGLAPELLKFEITESFIIEQSEKMLAWLQRIRDTGIGLSIDDFGTGYSSLSYLRRLPVDIVKIDRSFISELGINSNDGALVKGIIAIGHGLGMKMVAEGVETPEQLAFLQSAECDLVQGHYFSPALPLEGFAAFVEREARKAHPVS